MSSRPPSPLPSTERAERLLRRIVDIEDLDITARAILRGYLARDRSTTLRDLAAARLRALAPVLVHGADPVTDAAGWGLMVVLHSVPEPSGSLPAILDWAADAIDDAAPTIQVAWAWSVHAVA